MRQVIEMGGRVWSSYSLPNAVSVGVGGRGVMLAASSVILLSSLSSSMLSSSLLFLLFRSSDSKRVLVTRFVTNTNLYTRILWPHQQRNKIHHLFCF